MNHPRPTRRIPLLLSTALLLFILPNPGFTAELAYDDGTAEEWISWAGEGNGAAVRFTINAPQQLHSARVLATYTEDETLEVLVLNANGAGGSPGEALRGETLQVTANTLQFWSVNFNPPLDLPAGDFYIMAIPTSDVVIAQDTSSPLAGRSWEYFEGAWTQQPSDFITGNVMIRAGVEQFVPVSRTSWGRIKSELRSSP